MREGHYIEDQSEVTMVLWANENADVFIYQGEERQDATSLIENGDRLWLGNPLRFRNSSSQLDSEPSDLLLVMRKQQNGEIRRYQDSNYKWQDEFVRFGSSFRLTYSVEGERQTWVERYTWVVAVGIIAGVLVLMFLYMFVFRPFFMKKSIGLDLCYGRKRSSVFSSESSVSTRETTTVIPPPMVQNRRKMKIEGINVCMPPS